MTHTYISLQSDNFIYYLHKSQWDAAVELYGLTWVVSHCKLYSNIPELDKGN